MIILEIKPQPSELMTLHKLNYCTSRLEIKPQPVAAVPATVNNYCTPRLEIRIV